MKNLSKAQDMALASLTDEWKTLRELPGNKGTFDALVRRDLAEIKEVGHGFTFTGSPDIFYRRKQEIVINEADISRYLATIERRHSQLNVLQKKLNQQDRARKLSDNIVEALEFFRIPQKQGEE